MAVATGHAASFTFSSDRGSFSGGVTKVTVDAPTAEIVDVTGIHHEPQSTVLVPTGAWSGGAITVEYIVSANSGRVQNIVRGLGQLAFMGNNFSVTRQVVLESGSETVSAGDVVRGTLRFVMTDYYG